MSIAKKLKTVAENQQKVYDAGFTAGQATGGNTDAAYQAGFDAGKQAEYDAFWDAYQQNGKRTNYAYAFGGDGWRTAALFKPKYDLKPINANCMFAYGSLTGCDLKNLLESSGVVLDTSQTTNFKYFLQYSSPFRIPELDTRAANNLNDMVHNANVATIDKLILRDDGSQEIHSIIRFSPGLENIVIEGVIGSNVNLSESIKLTKASIESIMNALSDISASKTLQLSKTAVNNAFTTDAWNALVASKPNWTITLA